MVTAMNALIGIDNKGDATRVSYLLLAYCKCNAKNGMVARYCIDVEKGAQRQRDVKRVRHTGQLDGGNREELFRTTKQ